MDRVNYETAFHNQAVKMHIQMIEHMKTKFIDDCNKAILEKSIKKIYEKCKTPGKGDHVDISV